MIEVKDEILNGQPLYRIRDEQGNILHDNVTIEMITQLIQTGTPLNKNLFQNFYDDIVSKTDLTNKYNVPTLMEDEVYNYLTLDNSIEKYEKGLRVMIQLEHQFTPFSSSIIPVFNSDEVVNGYSISSRKDIADKYLAVDKNEETYARIPIVNDTSDKHSYFTISFPRHIKISKFKLVFERSSAGIPHSAGKSYTRASVSAAKHDGTGSVTLYTSTGTTEGKISEEREISSNVLFKSITVDLSTIFNGSSQAWDTYHNLFSLDILSGGIAIFKENATNYMNINNLGNKLINGTLTPGKKYELVYDGTAFNATEVVL